jgi:hypothetical protein
MVPAAARARPARKVTAKKRKPKAATVVATNECRSLVEDVAFFRAARFREVEPGKCRAEDRCAAEAEIKTVLKKLRKRPL